MTVEELMARVRRAVEGITEDGDDVTVVVARTEDWDLLDETLTLDAHSTSYDRDLRHQIELALERIEVEKL